MAITEANAMRTVSHDSTAKDLHEQESLGQGHQTKPKKSTMPEILRSFSVEERQDLEKKLVRKIDIRLIPILVVIYIMNYLDRNNIASARLAGLEDDLNLSSSQYQLCVSILFVGYILMQVPSNLFLDKIGKPSLYLPTCMIIWGIISSATAACKDFAGLLTIRFFLGFIEASFFPGSLFLLSSWYKRDELSFRVALLYSGSLISGAFSGLIAAGITNGMDGARGISAWQWLFIIEGAITVFIAFFAFFILPDFPKSTKSLTEIERALAQWRLEEDIGEEDWTGSEAQKIMHGLTLALKDVKTWNLMVLVFCCVACGSITNFFPSITETLNRGKITSLLLTAPPYAIAVITTFLNSLHADRTGERYFHITIPMWLSIVSFIIAVATDSFGARYFAMLIMPPTVYSGYVVALAWISNVLPRPVAKRAAALALINSVSNAAQIYTAFLYPKSAAPRYVLAMSVNAATALVGIGAATVLRFHLVHLNKKLDRGEEVPGAVKQDEALDENVVEQRQEQGIPGVGAAKGFRFLT